MALPLLTVDDVTQVFPLDDGGRYVALKDIDLTIAEGEFISLIGHSGCGKSTLLNLMAGLNQASTGGILMDGRQVTDPGPDRMVVFQNYSLLPWQTVRQNIALAVDNVMTGSSEAERRERIEQSIQLVGLGAAADKFPGELSGGMKQRVAIARALAIRPRLLLLDEPFGALDALTRGNLQQQLMQICQQAGVTTVMVTHDVDEALLLSDRVVCLTNGPEAGIGQILNVPLPRPRQRLDVMDHPDYYHLRSELISFLQQQRRLKQRKQSRPSVVPVAAPAVQTVRLGYLPGLDIAPLAMAMDRGLLQQRGLELKPVAFDRWQTLEDQLKAGELDVAITSATTPLALTLGLGGQGAWPAVTPMTVTRSGNALCLARRFSDLGIQDLGSLAAQIKGTGTRLRLAVAHKGNMQELLLRHWLASGGIDPDRDVELMALSPMAMEATLRAGEIDGFIAGRYRVAKALEAGLVTLLATDLDIWSDHPEKVLTCHENWALNHQDALLDLSAALMRGGQLCEDPAEHDHLVGLLGASQWLGKGSALALQSQFDFGSDVPSGVRLPLNRFHSDRAHLANSAEGSWILSQFSRWGWSPFPSNRLELLSHVYRSDLCSRALERAGFADLRPERAPFALADGLAFDQDNPLDYLKQLPYSRATALESIPLPSGSSQRPLAAH
ncbi:MAG: ATP-binding cassette domain-containing protein [Cyanobacteria bacterium M_surface_10_m1_298]|nr:ATP-binding cassette domain-containing protein [Cyanobacteria bacterium M_surface_10_m1_298]